MTWAGWLGEPYRSSTGPETSPAGGLLGAPLGKASPRRGCFCEGALPPRRAQLPAVRTAHGGSWSGGALQVDVISLTAPPGPPRAASPAEGMELDQCPRRRELCWAWEMRPSEASLGQSQKPYLAIVDALSVPLIFFLLNTRFCFGLLCFTSARVNPRAQSPSMASPSSSSPPRDGKGVGLAGPWGLGLGPDLEWMEPSLGAWNGRYLRTELLPHQY